jgi:hypothetical protein
VECVAIHEKERVVRMKTVVYAGTEKMFIKYKGVDLWTLKH